MTTPNEDPGPLAEIDEALATLRAAVLEYFVSNPIDDAHRQLDKDELHAQVVQRIQQTPDVSAQASDIHAAVQSQGQPAQHTQPVHKPASAHTAAGSVPAQAPAQVQAQAPHTATRQPAAAAKGHAASKGQAAIKGHAAIKEPAGTKLSGPEWADYCPQVSGGLADLTGDFRGDVEAFIAAMKAAGINVQVIDTIRSHKRAYLMHWSYLIMKGGVAKAADLVAQADKDKFEDVDIRWRHDKDGGVLDAEASVKAATELVGRLGIDPKLKDPPARDSRHVLGHAVDMTTEWGKGSIRILNAKNVSVDITDGPRSGLNPTLWEVGKTYGVWHYGTFSSDMSKPAHDRNHWSDNGH